MYTNKVSGFIAYLIIYFAFTGSAAAQQESQLKDPDWLKALIPKRIVYTVPAMEKVLVQKDLVYKQVGGTELKLDIYSPPFAQQHKPLPAIIFIHGGYLPANLLTKPKEWGIYNSYGQLAATSGFIAVTFNYRYYGWQSLVDAQNDIIDLISYVRGNAEKFGIDKARLNLWAFSGGGPFLTQALKETPPYIRTIVSYYATLDLQHLRKEIPNDITDDQLKTYSPISHLNNKQKRIPPIFIARAGLDSPSINTAVDRFIQEAFSNNITIDLSTHPEGRHGFDIYNNDERSREIIKRTIEFIQANN